MKVNLTKIILFLFMLLVHVSYGQTKQIKGKVINESSEPVVGATVGTNIGTNRVISNQQGEFLINLPNLATQLIVSNIGYEKSILDIGDKSYIEVVLKSQSSTLEEVVIVGYGTQKKKNITDAVISVGAKELSSRPITNLGQGLQGLVPGLTVSPGSGRPGSGATFNIRGMTSINGGSPLVLVDGVAMDPNLINPNDVASVSVLQDASSTAVYGVRGAFGVILITTRSGTKNQAMKIDYSGNYTFTRATRLPEQSSGLKYMEMHMDADKNGALSGGNRATNQYTDLDYKNAQKYAQDPTSQNSVYVDPANPNRYRYVGNTNWVKELYPGWAPQTQQNVSLSGGTDKTAFLGTLGYFNQKGLLKAANQNFDRYNIGMKMNSDVTKWLNLSLDMRLNRTDDNSPADTQIGSVERLSNDLRPLMPIKHPDGNYSGQSDFTNPFQVLELNGRSITKKNDLWFTGQFELKPIKNVKVTTWYTWNSYTENNRSNMNNFDYFGADGVNLGIFPWTNPARVTNSSQDDRYVALNSFGEYENTFAKKHYFKVVVGYNQELKETNGFNASVKNLINQNFSVLSLNNDPKPIVGANRDAYAVSGSFFRLNYTYDDRYLITLSGRYDGSSRFARGNRYVFVPTVSGAWRISNEKFFAPLKNIISDLKFRGSYGMTANQATKDLYPYIATLPYGQSSYLFASTQQLSVGAPSLVSSSFTWENVISKNIAVDFELLKGKISGSFDYYNRATKNMIVAGQPLPAVLGASAPPKNAADLLTKGFTFLVSWNDKIGKDVNYKLSVNLSDNYAYITKYNLNPTQSINSYIVGQRLNNIWGFETQGFYKSDADAAKVDNSQIWGGKWLAGDIQYKDLNGDGKVTRGNQIFSNSGDLRVIGNSTPRYLYGINFSATYRDFDLAIFAQGVGKQDVILGGNYFWGFTNEWQVPSTAQEDYWTPTNTSAYFPRLRFGGGGNFETQTKYLQNAAYLRLKQLTIGYTLPTKLTKKISVNKLRVYFSGQNMFEFTSLFKTYDPEQLDRVNDYPISRAYSFGLQLSL